jgi:hypothetical protein
LSRQALWPRADASQLLPIPVGEHVPGPPITPEQKTEIDKAVLHLYFEYLNLSYPPLRWLAFVAFVIGFICLLIPSIKVFFTVCLILAGLVF